MTTKEILLDVDQIVDDYMAEAHIHNIDDLLEYRRLMAGYTYYLAKEVGAAKMRWAKAEHQRKQHYGRAFRAAKKDGVTVGEAEAIANDAASADRWLEKSNEAQHHELKIAWESLREVIGGTSQKIAHLRTAEGAYGGMENLDEIVGNLLKAKLADLQAEK